MLEITKNKKVLKTVSETVTDYKDAQNIISQMRSVAQWHSKNNPKGCAGLAAIQVSIPKRIILVRIGKVFVQYINPEIIEKNGEPFIAKEGCLSLDGLRNVKRCPEILLQYNDIRGKFHLERFNGFTAQIIQHETDHCNGVLI